MRLLLFTSILLCTSFAKASSYEFKSSIAAEQLSRRDTNDHLGLFSRNEGSISSLNMEDFTDPHPLFAHSFVEVELNAQERKNYIDLRRFGVSGGWKDGFELFAGQDVIIWGKGDELNPIDVINAEDFSYFIVYNKDRRKIARPMARAKLRLYDTNLTIIAMPSLQRHYMPDPRDSSWCKGDCVAIQPDQIQKNYAKKNIAADISELNLPERQSNIDLGERYRNIGSDWESAVRLDRSFSTFDAALIYHEGVDRFPVYQRTFTGQQSMKMREINNFRPAYGADLSFTVGSVAIRGEFIRKEQKGYMIDPSVQLFQTDDDGLVYGNEIEYLIGADIELPGSIFFSTQYFERMNDLSYIHVLLPKGNKLISTTLRRNFLNDDLTLEYRALYDLEQGSTAIFPTVRYKLIDNLSTQLQGNLFNGSQKSLFGEYQENSGVLASITYTL